MPRIWNCTVATRTDDGSLTFPSRAAGDFLGRQRIGPEHQHGIAAAVAITGQIIGEDALGLEALYDLEIDHGIAQLPLGHCVKIGLRIGIVPATTRITGQAAAKGDALQLEILAQFLALAIKTLADAQAAEIRIDADFHAVEDIAIGIMTGPEAVAGDFAPAVRRKGGLLRNDQGRAMTDDGALIVGDELAFGKVVDLAPDMRGGHRLRPAIDLG
jgi:hypothetical protein